MKQIILSFVFLLLGFAQDYDFSDFTNNISSKMHNKDYIKNNFLNPATGNGKTKTLDGKVTLDTHVTCDDVSNPYLIISISGSSDIDITIKVDKEADGIIDKTFSFYGISGVGTNGVAICDSNTFNNCSYKAWQLDSLLNVSLIKKTKSVDIIGLYCINSSCGSLSLNDKERILQDIASGIVNLFQTNNPNYVVTKTAVDNNKIKIFGQRMNGCNQESIYSPSSLPTESNINSYSSYMDRNNSAYDVLYTTNEINNTALGLTPSDINTTINNGYPQNITPNSDITHLTFDYNSSVSENMDLNASKSLEKKYCTVVKNIKKNQVLEDGNVVGTTGGSSVTEKTEIRECTGDSSLTCPYNPDIGESIKYDCSTKHKGLAETTAILSNLNEMSKDFTCSK